VVITFLSPPGSCDQGSPEFTTPRWSLDILRKGWPPEHIGVLTAPNQEQAFLRAIEAFELSAYQQSRVIVRRLADRPGE
jgi:hypothetical protein